MKAFLELPLKYGTKISGHICQGHIDTVGKVYCIKKIDKSFLFDFEIPKKERKSQLCSSMLRAWLSHFCWASVENVQNWPLFSRNCTGKCWSEWQASLSLFLSLSLPLPLSLSLSLWQVVQIDRHRAGQGLCVPAPGNLWKGFVQTICMS